MKGAPSQNFAPSAALFAQTLEEAFPDVDSKHTPLGTKVIVQMRVAKEETKGGIVIVREARETVQANTLVAKVVSVGPLAFHSKDGKPWPEGSWFKVGDYVRCPRYGGDQWEVPINPEKPDEVVMFRIFDHLQFSAVVKDPLDVIAYV